MKKIFLVVLIIMLNVSVSPQQPQDSIFVNISGDTVHIWNTGALENCASSFRMDVAFSEDTIFVIEVDTTDMYVPCLCYYELCSSITGLQSGFYIVKIYRDLPLIFPDTLLYIGSTSFTYSGSSIPFITKSYQSDCDPITSIEENGSAPDEFELFQNHPNPFNPNTVIGYQLPVSGNVLLKVYDVLGNEVATLVNGQVEAGKHKIDYDASGLKSGVYFYKLVVSALQSKDGKAGEFVDTKKMILLK
jgi:hypothetical protein